MKNAWPVGRRLISQYETIAKRNVMMTFVSSGEREEGEGTEERKTDEEVCYEECCWTVKTICTFLNHCSSVLEESRNVCDSLSLPRFGNNRFGMLP